MFAAEFCVIWVTLICTVAVQPIHPTTGITSMLHRLDSTNLLDAINHGHGKSKMSPSSNWIKTSSAVPKAETLAKPWELAQLTKEPVPELVAEVKVNISDQIEAANNLSEAPAEEIAHNYPISEQQDLGFAYPLAPYEQHNIPQNYAMARSGIPAAGLGNMNGHEITDAQNNMLQAMHILGSMQMSMDIVERKMSRAYRKVEKVSQRQQSEQSMPFTLPAGQHAPYSPVNPTSQNTHSAQTALASQNTPAAQTAAASQNTPAAQTAAATQNTPAAQTAAATQNTPAAQPAAAAQGISELQITNAAQTAPASQISHAVQSASATQGISASQNTHAAQTASAAKGISASPNTNAAQTATTSQNTHAAQSASATQGISASQNTISAQTAPYVPDPHNIHASQGLAASNSQLTAQNVPSAQNAIAPQVTTGTQNAHVSNALSSSLTQTVPSSQHNLPASQSATASQNVHSSNPVHAQPSVLAFSGTGMRHGTPQTRMAFNTAPLSGPSNAFANGVVSSPEPAVPTSGSTGAHASGVVSSPPRQGLAHRSATPLVSSAAPTKQEQLNASHVPDPATNGQPASVSLPQLNQPGTSSHSITLSNKPSSQGQTNTIYTPSVGLKNGPSTTSHSQQATTIGNTSLTAITLLDLLNEPSPIPHSQQATTTNNTSLTPTTLLDLLNEPSPIPHSQQATTIGNTSLTPITLLDLINELSPASQGQQATTIGNTNLTENKLMSQTQGPLVSNQARHVANTSKHQIQQFLAQPSKLTKNPDVLLNNLEHMPQSKSLQQGLVNREPIISRPQQRSVVPTLTLNNQQLNVGNPVPLHFHQQDPYMFAQYQQPITNTPISSVNNQTPVIYNQPLPTHNRSLIRTLNLPHNPAYTLPLNDQLAQSPRQPSNKIQEAIHLPARAITPQQKTGQYFTLRRSSHAQRIVGSPEQALSTNMQRSQTNAISPSKALTSGQKNKKIMSQVTTSTTRHIFRQRPTGVSGQQQMPGQAELMPRTIVTTRKTQRRYIVNGGNTLSNQAGTGHQNTLSNQAGTGYQNTLSNQAGNGHQNTGHGPSKTNADLTFIHKSQRPYPTINLAQPDPTSRNIAAMAAMMPTPVNTPTSNIAPEPMQGLQNMPPPSPPQQQTQNTQQQQQQQQQYHNIPYTPAQQQTQSAQQQQQTQLSQQQQQQQQTQNHQQNQHTQYPIQHKRIIVNTEPQQTTSTVSSHQQKTTTKIPCSHCGTCTVTSVEINESCATEKNLTCSCEANSCEKILTIQGNSINLLKMCSPVAKPPRVMRTHTTINKKQERIYVYQRK